LLGDEFLGDELGDDLRDNLGDPHKKFLMGEQKVFGLMPFLNMQYNDIVAVACIY